MTMEVTAFEPQTLADKLFAVPDGFKEVKTLADLTAASKRTGSVRVGVVPITTKLKDEMSLQILSDALVVSMNDAAIDAVALEASSASAALSEARAKSVDYLLVAEVTEIRKPQRGLVGRVTGARDFGAKVDYLLMAPGSTNPTLSSSERSGASTLQSAVTTAKTVSRYMTPMGLLGQHFNFMQTYLQLTGSQNGAAGATPVPTSDQTLNTLFHLMDTVAGPEPPRELADTADAAVANALEKVITAVGTKIKK
jgi:hypothetical protein